jgi:predicted house-cleaning noncanonical NTP pyrophosphatase (MazG superfamily)
MKFHRFKIAKLIRDKLPSMGVPLGFRHQIRHLQGVEHIDHLKLKLLEEAAEVQEATSKGDLTEEMADVFEVLHALAKANHISLADIEQKRMAKEDLRGGFDNGTYCAHMDVPTGHPDVQKYQAMSHKYPELGMVE